MDTGETTIEKEVTDTTSEAINIHSKGSRSESGVNTVNRGLAEPLGSFDSQPRQFLEWERYLHTEELRH